MGPTSEHVLQIGNSFDVPYVSTGSIQCLQMLFCVIYCLFISAEKWYEKKVEEMAFDFKAILIDSEDFYPVKSAVRNICFFVSEVFRLMCRRK